MDTRYWIWLGARLLAGVVLIAWAMSYLKGGSEEKEFQKTLEAMKQVHSFRIAYTANRGVQHFDMLWEVDCERDILHHQMHVVDTTNDPPAEINEDQVYVGGAQGGEYDRQADGSWKKHGYASQTAKGTCRYLAQGMDSNVLPHIATMIKRGILQKGDKKTVNGVRCREWLVTMKGGTSGLEHDTICIGLEDRLPYEMTVDWENSHTSISDYNAAIRFDVPESVLQPASAIGGTN